jgi:hypothetical protein
LVKLRAEAARPRLGCSPAWRAGRENGSQGTPAAIAAPIVE